MLCSRCIATFDNLKISRTPFIKLRRPPLNEFEVLHSSLASLRRALDEGCQFCHWLIRTKKSVLTRKTSKIFSGFELQEDIETEPFTVKCRFAYETPSKSVILCWSTFDAKKAGKPVQEKSMEYIFLAPEQKPLILSPSDEFRDGADATSISIIQSWIDRCINSHTRCRGKHIQESRPKFARILDVGHRIDAADVRLRLSRDLPESVRYITLSHCWGGVDSKIPSLTTTNYDEYCRHIAIETLPQTFQDAILLARRLQIQYVWIDSLCIIQNSKEDWLTQAAIMGEVYHGSYLNVAASRSQDSQGGLFSERNPLATAPLRIGITESTAQSVPSPMPQHPDWRVCKLKTDSILVVVTPPHPLMYTEQRFELNALLGNRDGEFCLRGENFALSARNVRLHDGSLHAELRTLHGDWKFSSITRASLSEVIPELEGLIQASWLEGLSTLVIKCPSADATLKWREIDLDEHIGNADGKFNWDGKNFTASARDISLEGQTLSADLKNLEGAWHRDSTDLKSLIDKYEVAEDTTFEEAVIPERIFYDVGTDYYSKWSAEITRAYLCTRGWVIQERLLAPRVVHFGKQQLYFECVESRSAEQDPQLEIDCRQPIARNCRMDFKAWDVFSSSLLVEPKPRQLGVNYVWSSVKAMFGRSNISFSKQDLIEDQKIFQQALTMCYGEERWTPTHPLIKYWSAILTTYSSAKLTYEEDRLLAIMGLAKILSNRTGISYVAGLWKYQLPRQLLWNNHVASDPSKSDDTGSNAETTYIAPSWSPASCKALLGGRGIALDPILETKGAMDLISVVEVDVKGALEQDKPTFGRIQEARLRLRGRLLPISLNLNAWPEGENRPHCLVQYWSGSKKESPVSELFLVPTLFTRWNEKLPSSTANSLLLESTKDAGVFRRVGLARLSSRCPLTDIVPQLYSAQSSHHEDEDDDADTEGEAAPEDLLLSQMALESQTVPPNPQQELATARMEIMKSSFVSGSLESLQKRGNDNLAKSSGNLANVQRLQRAQKGLSQLQAGLRMARSEFAGKSAPKGHFDAKTIEESMTGDGHNVTVTMRRHQWIRKPVTTLSPRKAVGEHFFLRYEDDEDAPRYGHFVFDII